MFKYVLRWNTNQILILKISNSVLRFRFYICSTSSFISSVKTSNLAFAMHSLHLWVFSLQWLLCITLMSFSYTAILSLNLSWNSFHFATSFLSILVLT